MCALVVESEVLYDKWLNVKEDKNISDILVIMAFYKDIGYIKIIPIGNRLIFLSKQYEII